MKKHIDLEDFKEIVDQAENGYMIADGEGLILYTNQAYLRAVSQVDIMEGHYMQEYIKSSSLLLSIERKKTVSMVTTSTGIHGKKIAVVTSTPYLDAEGNIYKVITQTRDQTELEMLKSQIKMLEEYIDKNEMQVENRPDFGPGVVVLSDQMRHVMDLANKVIPNFILRSQVQHFFLCSLPRRVREHTKELGVKLKM